MDKQKEPERSGKFGWTEDDLRPVKETPSRGEKGNG